ncbi:MAG: PKD domain-containing protein, partial [Bacteroidia bacterium]
NLRAPLPYLFARSVGCADTIPFINWRMVYIQDVTPVCASINWCGLGLPIGTLGGNEEYLWQGQLDFTNVSHGCTEFEIGYYECCRLSTVLTTNGGGIWLGGLEIDLSTSPCNNSARMVTPLLQYVCVGQAVDIPLTMVDPDGDLLVYRIDTCDTHWVNGTSIPVAYNPGYTALQPFGTSWNIQLDSVTGILRVQPQPGAIGEYMLCVSVDEFRNGQLLNTAKMDMHVKAITCQRRAAPSIDSIANIIGGERTDSLVIHAVAGMPLDFQVYAHSQSTLDTLLSFELGLRKEPSSATGPIVQDPYRGPFLRSSTMPPGMLLTQSGKNPAIAQVRWTPPIVGFYPVSILVHNNQCPLHAEAYGYINVVVDTAWITARVDDITCARGDGAIDITNNGIFGPYQYQWSTGDTTADLLHLRKGAYSLTVTDRLGRLSRFRFEVDSLVNTIRHRITSGLYVCDSALIDLYGFTSTAYPPLQYRWSTGDTTVALKRALMGKGYNLKVTDSIGCSKTAVGRFSAVTICGYVLSGIIYHDLDSSCTRDFNETPVPYAWLRVDGRWIQTDSFGRYQTTVYDSLIVNPYAARHGFEPIASCKLDTVRLDTLRNKRTFHFPVKYDGSFTPFQNAAVGMMTPPFVRPGMPAIFTFNVSNYSLGPFTGYLETYLDTLFSVMAVRPAPDYISPASDTIRWLIQNLSNLQPFSPSITLQADSTVALGTPYRIHAHLFPDSQDVRPTDNVIDFTRRVVGSFDPNDKQASPPPRGSEGWLKEDEAWIAYTIRFQNTGTDTAFYVEILDTLDSETLVPRSLSVLQNSHPYSVSILEDSIVEFRFDNIRLPDSARNVEASQGYVHFKIRRKPQLPYLTQIKNKAAIYFDFNKPVITSEVLHTIYEKPQLKYVDNGPICRKAAIEIMVEKGAKPYRYFWQGSQHPGQRSSTAVDSAGTYKVLIEDAIGTKDSLTINPVLIPSPNANFSWKPTGAQVDFLANGQHNASWSWDFGDGDFATNTPSPVHTYAANGTYHVRLITENMRCGFDTVLQTVNLSTVSIEGVFDKNTITAHPNPFQNGTWISFPNSGRQALTFSLFDVYGKKIKEIQNIRENSFYLSALNLKPGVYFLLPHQSGAKALKLLLCL